MLKLTDVTKSYAGADGPIEVLRGVSFEVNTGDTLALTGESGSGKSTLLHLIGGLDQAEGGQISFDGRDITHLGDAERAALRRSEIGVIFQQFNLIPSLDVGANIAFQARLARRYDAQAARALATKLGLEGQLSKYPEQLSGGQQQRVAIARTLAARPKLVLADEPTGNLDEDTAAQVLAEMLALVAATGAALITVTHSPQVAAQMGQTLRLSHGQLA
ncbi:MAG: ABC transporter ATP-binding protein [Pseudomonadota bacterium]